MAKPPRFLLVSTQGLLNASAGESTPGAPKAEIANEKRVEAGEEERPTLLSDVDGVDRVGVSAGSVRVGLPCESLDRLLADTMPIVSSEDVLVTVCSIDDISVGDVNADGEADLVVKVHRVVVTATTKAHNAAVLLYRGPLEVGGSLVDLEPDAALLDLDVTGALSPAFIRSVGSISVLNDATVADGSLVLVPAEPQGSPSTSSAFQIVTLRTMEFGAALSYLASFPRPAGLTRGSPLALRLGNLTTSHAQDIAMVEPFFSSPPEAGEGTGTVILRQGVGIDESVLQEDVQLVVPNEVAGTVLPAVLAVGDVTDDGLDDIFFVRTGFATGNVTIVGMFSPHWHVNVASRVSLWAWQAPPGAAATGISLAVVDVTGDTLPDLIVSLPHADEGTGRVFVFASRDVATLQPLPTFEIAVRGVVGFGSSVTAVDLNDDGVLDLVVASEESGDVGLVGWIAALDANGGNGTTGPTSPGSTAYTDAVNFTAVNGSTSAGSVPAVAGVVTGKGGATINGTAILAVCLSTIVLLAFLGVGLLLRRRQADREAREAVKDRSDRPPGRVSRSHSRASSLHGTARRSRASTGLAPKDAHYGETSLYRTTPGAPS